jgi:hypothetical protein
MRCRLCGEDKSLIEAHIIAQCMHGPLQHPTGPMILVSKDVDSYPKRVQTGQYDREILCTDCDNIFSPWEKYAANLLMIGAAYERFREAKPGEDFYRIQEYDYAALKLCLLSILWKMSISKRPSFRRVVLGPFEHTIRQMLLDKNPGPTEEFPVFIVRLIDEVGSATLRGTERVMRHGVNVYHLGLPGYVAEIKVDSRPTPLPLGPRVLAPDKPLIVALRNSNYSLAKVKSTFLDKARSRNKRPR